MILTLGFRYQLSPAVKLFTSPPSIVSSSRSSPETRTPSSQAPQPSPSSSQFSLGFTRPNVADAYAKLGVKGSVEFASKILEEAHVAVVPGIAFGSDDHVRLSFASSMEQIDKGLDRIAAALS